MTQITDIYKFTQYWKDKFPNTYEGKSDEDIINLVKQRYPKQNIPTYEEALQTDTSYQTVQKKPKDYPDGSLMNQNIDPSWVDSWYLTSDFIPEKWQEEGALGGLISADFFRQSYNNSMAGMLYRTAHGKDKWDVSEKYDPSWYSQAGQFAVGMASPLDVVTMIATGSLGKVASVGAKASLFGGAIGKKTIEKGLLANYAFRNKTAGVVMSKTIDGALNLGIGGGTFAASHAMLNETARQRTENPDKPVNISKALKVASDEFLHSFPMFAVPGGLTQGIMGSIFGYTQAMASKSPSYAQKLTLAATSPAARVGTEAALFTSLPSVFGDEEAPKLGSTEWWAGLGTNALIIGGMRAVGSFVEPKLVTKDGKKVSMEAFDVLNQHVKMGETSLKNEIKVQKNVQSSLKEVGQDAKIITDRITQLETALKDIPKGLEQFKKDYKFIQEVNSKIDTDSNYLVKGAKLGSKENLELAKYQKLINDHSTNMVGTIASVLDDDLAATLYKSMYNKSPNATELKIFTKALENVKDDIPRNQKPVDDYLTGDWQTSPDGINGGQTTLKPVKVKQTRESEIGRYVNLLAGEKKVLPKEIIAEPAYQRDIVIPGENVLSLRKLKDAYKAEIQKRPGTPSTELTKILTDLDVTKASELPVFSKKIAGKTTIKDYISKLKLDKTNEKMLYQGISEFMQTRKSSNNPSNYKIIADYAKWLESKGKNLSEANRSLTDLYVNEQNAAGKLTTKNQRSQLNNSLSAFYGTGGVGKQPLDTGFAYKYMGTKEKTPAVSQLGVDRGGTLATQEKIALVEPKDYGLIRAKNKELIKEGLALQGKGKQTVDPLTYDVATELLYNFGSRGKDTFERLFIENIDIRNGVIREWSAGAGQKGAAGPRLSIPLKKLDPELFSKIVKLIGNRKSGNLLKGLDGKNLLGDSVNIINAAIMPKGVNLRGKKGKLTVGDYRKMALTDAFEIGGDQLREFVKLELVKQKKNITQRYTIQDYNANWKKFIDGRKALDKRKAAPVKEKRAKRLPAEEVFQSKGDKAVRDKFVARVMKKNNLNESQLKVEGLSKGVLGEFGEGVIKLQKNIFQPADFYHENLHRLKAFARASKNKGLEKLIARGEKLAINTKEYKAWKKNNINRDVEEFLADIAGGKASRMEFTKGVLPKINQFIKQLVSRVKVAFGAGNFKDISNVLAKRVQKGFSTEGVEFARGQVKFKMEGMSESQAQKYGRKVFNEYFKKDELLLSGRNMRSRIEKHIGDIAQLAEDFKLSKANPIEIEQFVSTLRSMEPNIIKRLPDKLGWFEAFKDLESQRLSKNITEAKRASLLKDLGVPEGSVYKASAKQLRDFLEVIETIDDVGRSSTAWIQQRVAAGLVDKNIADKFLKLSVLKPILPVNVVLESSGLNKVAQKLYNHTHSKLGYEGLVSTYEANMKSLYGNKRWDTVKEFTYLFDKERYFERLDKKYLTNKEKKFMNETFDINVDKKTMTPKKGKPGEIVNSHKKLMKEYKDEFLTIIKENLNEAQYEKYIKDKPIKWIENNIYVQRRLTQEAKIALDVTGFHYKKMIKSQEEAVAKRLAKKYFDEEVKRNYTKQEFEKKKASFIDDGTAASIARANYHELSSDFNAVKHSPNFYKNRHEKLPEKIKTESGKLIETYETSYSATTKDYSIGQSQFLATLEYFPEYIRMKGYSFKIEDRLVERLKSGLKTRKLGNYLEEALNEHLKISKHKSSLPDGMNSTIRFLTSTAAKFQLSAPTSGLKNFLVGNTQSLLAFKYKDFFLGLKDAIQQDNRAYVRATGATEIGMRSIEVQGAAGKFDKYFADKVFRFGGMRPSENINRYISVLAGKRDQLGLSRVLQTTKKGTRAYNNAVNKLKTFYKLSDKEIALLKEFGMNGTRGLDAKIAGLNKRKLDKLYQKMNTFAHINTQGAAINLFMPDWAKNEVAQAGLLYKKMAYAASVNTTRNLKIAYQNKSLFQPIAFGLGTYFSGEAMLAFYDKFYGQSMPKENSSEARQFTTVMWKGEFLGLLSEMLSPFSNESPIDSMYPSLLSTGSMMWNAAMSMIKGDAFVGQGAKDFFKPSIGIYNAASKVYSRGLLSKDSYASQSKRYSALYRDYVDEINDRDEALNLNQTKMEFEMNKYMRAFREVFESGYEKDDFGNSLGKWYMMCLFAKANDYYYTKFDENGIPVDTPKEALKKAVKSMETTLTNLNPNKASITAKTKKARGKQAIKGINFLNWLDSKEKLSPGLKKLSNQYAHRYKLVKKSMAEYIKEGNLEKDLKYYGISIADILK